MGTAQEGAVSFVERLQYLARRHHPSRDERVELAPAVLRPGEVEGGAERVRQHLQAVEAGDAQRSGEHRIDGEQLAPAKDPPRRPASKRHIQQREEEEGEDGDDDQRGLDELGAAEDQLLLERPPAEQGHQHEPQRHRTRRGSAGRRGSRWGR